MNQTPSNTNNKKKAGKWDNFPLIILGLAGVTIFGVGIGIAVAFSGGNSNPEVAKPDPALVMPLDPEVNIESQTPPSVHKNPGAKNAINPIGGSVISLEPGDGADTPMEDGGVALGTNKVPESPPAISVGVETPSISDNVPHGFVETPEQPSTLDLGPGLMVPSPSPSTKIVGDGMDPDLPEEPQITPPSVNNPGANNDNPTTPADPVRPPLRTPDLSDYSLLSNSRIRQFFWDESSPLFAFLKPSINRQLIRLEVIGLPSFEKRYFEIVVGYRPNFAVELNEDRFFWPDRTIAWKRGDDDAIIAWIQNKIVAMIEEQQASSQSDLPALDTAERVLEQPIDSEATAVDLLDSIWEQLYYNEPDYRNLIETGLLDLDIDLTPDSLIVRIGGETVTTATLTNEGITIGEKSALNRADAVSALMDIIDQGLIDRAVPVEGSVRSVQRDAEALATQGSFFERFTQRFIDTNLVDFDPNNGGAMRRPKGGIGVVFSAAGVPMSAFAPKASDQEIVVNIFGLESRRFGGDSKIADAISYIGEQVAEANDALPGVTPLDNSELVGFIKERSRSRFEFDTEDSDGLRIFYAPMLEIDEIDMTATLSFTHFITDTETQDTKLQFQFVVVEGRLEIRQIRDIARNIEFLSQPKRTRVNMLEGAKWAGIPGFVRPFLDFDDRREFEIIKYVIDLYFDESVYDVEVPEREVPEPIQTRQLTPQETATQRLQQIYQNYSLDKRVSLRWLSRIARGEHGAHAGIEMTIIGTNKIILIMTNTEFWSLQINVLIDRMYRDFMDNSASGVAEAIDLLDTEIQEALGTVNK